MTLNDFWNGHPQDFFVYKDFYEEKIRQQQEEKDYYSWLQGLYFVSSIAQCLQFKNPKKIYPKEPYSILEKKKNMNIAQKAMAWIDRVNRKIDKGA